MAKVKVKAYKFTVEGKWTGAWCAFPFDMLRYDRCYPANSVDASRIAEIVSRIVAHDATPVQITLIGPDKPTEGRWISFGWRVIDTKALT